MTTNENTILIDSKCWIPEHLVNIEKVRKNYLIYHYDNKGCDKCEFKQERHYYVCDNCPAFVGKYKLYEKKNINGKNYIGLHIGDKENFVKKAGLKSNAFDNVQDLRAKPKHKIPDLEFTGKLRSYQKDARKQWREALYGQLMAPPRSGKTILAVKFTLDFGLKTLILVHQGDLLTQMLKSFYEFTNIKDVEFSQGKELIGIAKNSEDFKRWPIVLSTYQKFISPAGKKRLAKLVRKFGFVIVDEVHRANSTCFSTVLSKFESLYKIGFTATPVRKDKLEFIIEHILGPVTSKVTPEQVQAKLMLHITETKPKYEYKTWVPAMQFLARDKKRMEIIANQVVKDVKKGHHVLLPVVFIKQAQELTDLINKKLFNATGKENLAIAFTSKIKDREEVLEKIRKGKYKVTVGIRSLIQAGINVPRWSALYVISPISNRPNFQQESARIRTPMEGKRQPIVRMFVDIEMGMCRGCFGTCWHDLKDFDMSEETKEKALSVLKTLSSFRANASKGDYDDLKPVRLIGGSSESNTVNSKPRGLGFSGINPNNK